MQITLDLKDNLTNGDPGGPVIEATLSLAHSALVAAGVDANVCADARVQPVLHAPQALADALLAVLELGGADAAVVVQQADAVVAPDERRAACAAARGHAGPTFAIFFVCACAGEQPVLCGWGAGECAGLGGEEGEDG